MPLEKTYEELLAYKIKPRNYSSVLPIIYNLRTRSNKNYIPQAPSRIVFSATQVGTGAGTAKTFEPLSGVNGTSYKRGDEIQLTGVASYLLSDGATPTIKSAIKLTAQIDANKQNSSYNLTPYQWDALGSEISSSGAYLFKIPKSITQQLSLGTHYVYIDAHSPDNAPVRLVASGTPTDPSDPLWYTRSFTITA